MFIISRLKSISKVQIVALVLIVIGLVMTVRYAVRTFEAYREAQFAIRNNFEAGNPDPDLIRPWMTMRYIAVAYTVPQEYLFDHLGIEMERRNSNASLHELNEQFFNGRRAEAEYPIIVDELRTAIREYRDDPVSTGLRENGVRPWMSIQYIATVAGIPADYLFEQIGLPPDDNAFIPLNRLSEEVEYEGGVRGLTEALQNAVDTYEATD